MDALLGKHGQHQAIQVERSLPIQEDAQTYVNRPVQPLRSQISGLLVRDVALQVRNLDVLGFRIYA